MKGSHRAFECDAFCNGKNGFRRPIRTWTNSSRRRRFTIETSCSRTSFTKKYDKQLLRNPSQIPSNDLLTATCGYNMIIPAPEASAKTGRKRAFWQSTGVAAVDLSHPALAGGTNQQHSGVVPRASAAGVQSAAARS